MFASWRIFGVVAKAPRVFFFVITCFFSTLSSRTFFSFTIIQIKSTSSFVWVRFNVILLNNINIYFVGAVGGRFTGVSPRPVVTSRVGKHGPLRVEICRSHGNVAHGFEVLWLVVHHLFVVVYYEALEP